MWMENYKSSRYNRNVENILWTKICNVQSFHQFDLNIKLKNKHKNKI